VTLKTHLGLEKQPLILDPVTGPLCSGQFYM